MDNLINETNEHLQGIINNLQAIGREYEDKLNKNTEMIESEKEKATTYKRDFDRAEATVNKMNADIVGFENDYNHLVEKFKDDELSSILIAANREISTKIDERKKKILKDQIAMNSLVQKAESVKTKLVKLYAEKKVLEYCYQQIVDAYDYYSTELGKIINYSNAHKDYLCECYEDKDDEVQISNEPIATTANTSVDNDYADVLKDDFLNINMDGLEDVLDNPVGFEKTDEPSIEVNLDADFDEEDNEIEDIEYDEIEIEDDDSSEDDLIIPNIKEKDDNNYKDIEIDDSDDFVYLDNLELDEEDSEDNSIEDESNSSEDIKEVIDATAKELDEMIDTDDSKNELLSYLEITDEDLEKLINQSDDLED